MNDLEELLARTQIDFPIPITADEVESGLFDYLRKNAQFTVEYYTSYWGRKEQKVVASSSDDERYVFDIKGSISHPLDFGSFVSPTFRMAISRNQELSITFFKSIKFDTVPGYDSVKDFETLSTGKEQIRLFDEIRKRVTDYFSERPK